MPLSQIEKSVTHLLVATKQLLETLTQWSRGQATDTQVSDVYVRLGYEFNMACRAFTAINVDTSDLGNVPDLLRSILEATLSQEASSESLEKYLPRIRDIIINLLHGLKRKQQRLRQRQGRDREGQGLPERSTSVSTVTSSGSNGLTSMINDGIDAGGHAQDSRRPEPTMNNSPTRKPVSRESSQPKLPGELPGQDAQLPYPPDNGGMSNSTTASSLLDVNPDSFPPPPPDPQQSSAMAALQKGGDLERRASRRYSQYQISKHLGASGSGVPILPPQNSPIPNRGRKEARESLRAVQKRESVRHSRTPSKLASSPMRAPETAFEQPAASNEQRNMSPEGRSPDKYVPSATISGPLIDPSMYMDDSKPSDSESKTDVKQSNRSDVKPGEAYFQVSPPPTPTKDLTLFLQYKSKIKKIVLPEGRDELSLGRLQLAFIEKFSWNTQQNGTDLPEIYIQDPVSGVRHELEDLSDIKDRTVLVLNVEALDEVKKHFDDGLSTLTTMVKQMKQNYDDQAATLQRVSERQQQQSNDMARLATASPATIPSSDSSRSINSGPKLAAGHLTEIQTLRRDIAVLRQTYSTFQSDIQSSMSGIRQKAAAVKTAASKAAAPNIDGDAGYSYVTNGRKKLNTDSDHLVGKVDDLQDLIEDLRKDLAQRGVRPLPRQIASVNKDIEEINKELTRMEQYMTNEKPIWTKIWEKELEDVCQGRDELRLMEDLLIDLRDDLDKASETFTLVEQASKEHLKDPSAGGGGRSFSKGLANLGNSIDQGAAKEDMLGEVRALQPNHEDRLEAIERAEKLRQKELLNRKGNPMQREIEEFVGEGKLKKSGGFEEVERARVAMDEKIRREVWDRMNGLLPEDGEEFEEEEEEEEEEEGEEEFEEASEHPGEHH